MTSNGHRHRIRNAIRRHKVISTIIAIPLTPILLLALLVTGLTLKWDVIDPTYYPRQEKTIYSFTNPDRRPEGGEIFVAICSESPETLLTIYDSNGHRIDQTLGAHQLQAAVPPQQTYTFVSRNTTDKWLHARVHECDTYT